MPANRREFLQQSGGVLAGVSTAAAIGLAAKARAEAANTLVMGGIGCGGQGTSLLKSFASIPGVQVGYVCDPDASRAAAAAKAVAEISGKSPKVVSDLRRVLDDKSVHAVTIATPDHWHAPAGILACQAEKHIYVEKPCAHNVWEGRKLIEAAANSGRIVQHGTHSRSISLVVHAIDLLRKGVIGKVLVAKAWNVQKRSDIGHAAASEPPAGLDYELWLGPAPHVPFQPNRLHYNWHWWHDFGTGDMGNDGVHELDIARWGLGVETHPNKIAAIGGKLFFNDDQQFPDTQYVAFDYEGDGKPASRRQLVFEMRIWSPYSLDGVDNGNAFYGTEGWMMVSKRGILKVFGRDDKPITVDKAPEITDHRRNFVDAVRDGAAVRSNITTGHLSSSLCHLGNIAVRVGRQLKFDPESESIVGDSAASALLRREYRDGHWAVPAGAKGTT